MSCLLSSLFIALARYICSDTTLQSQLCEGQILWMCLESRLPFQIHQQVQLEGIPSLKLSIGLKGLQLWYMTNTVTLLGGLWSYRWLIHSGYVNITWFVSEIWSFRKMIFSASMHSHFIPEQPSLKSSHRVIKGWYFGQSLLVQYDKPLIIMTTLPSYTRTHRAETCLNWVPLYIA